MLPFVVDLSVRITVAAGLVGLVLAVLRIRSAAARHAAWTAVLLTMVAMPVLTAIVPRIPVPVPSHLRPSSGAVAVQLEGPASSRRLRSEDDTSAPMSAARESLVEPPQASPLPAEPRVPVTIYWLAFGIAAYFAGVVVLSARLVIGWRLARRLVRSATRLDLTAAAPVFESTFVAAPLTTGILTPSIVLPTGWRRWPADMRRAVLAHENAHVRRRDLVVQFLARLNRALLWFHPLAWWLERQLAVTSEQACDDAVVRSGGEPRRYAEILLGIAEAVSHRGQRIAWTAVGMDGSGLLGARIDRVLRGDVAHSISLTRRISAAAGCVVVLVFVLACRTESATPLTPDPSVALRLELQKLRTKEFEAARDMPLDQVDALEARIEKDPNDWEAREQLVTYYSAGREVPWDRKVPGLRRHALWLIEHHPEHDVAAPALSPEHDPQGFAEAVGLWESHLETPDASPYLVYRAARFFMPHDKPRAEQLLLKGLAMDPQSEALQARRPENVGGYQWASQLAMLYASALLGSEHYGYPTYDAERARSPFAMSVRQKLADSTDARLLVQVGQYLSRRGRSGAGAEEIRALGDAYLRRAVQIDPDLTLARAALVGLRSRERHERLYEARRNNAPVSEEDQLAYLAEQALNGVLAADSINYYKNDQAAARAEQQNAVQHAEEALALAAQRPQDPTYSSSVATAHFVLAAEAIRSGDRDEAIDHLMAATEVPATDDIVYSQAAAWLRPVNYLLEAGERDRVIAFLEAFARLNVVQRNRLLEDANDIRQGVMPSAYQHMLARESAPGLGSGPGQQ